MPVAVSMPCEVGRWPTCAFGVLGENNTCGFLHPPCTSHRRMRLFLERFLIAGNEPLPDDQTGISIGISAHSARLAEGKRRAGSIAFYWMSFGIAHHQAMTTSTFSGRIARVDAGSQDTHVVRLILGVLEDPPLHPVGPFGVPAMAILAPGRLETAQMLKHQDARLLCLCKLDNASTDQMRVLIIDILDFPPEICVILFPFCDKASFASLAGNPSKQLRASSRISLCHRQ